MYVLKAVAKVVTLGWCEQGREDNHKLSFVDLAGSERAGRTGNTGHRLRCAAAASERRLLALCLSKGTPLWIGSLASKCGLWSLRRPHSGRVWPSTRRS